MAVRESATMLRQVGVSLRNEVRRCPRNNEVCLLARFSLVRPRHHGGDMSCFRKGSFAGTAARGAVVAGLLLSLRVGMPARAAASASEAAAPRPSKLSIAYVVVFSGMVALAGWQLDQRAASERSLAEECIARIPMAEKAPTRVWASLTPQYYRNKAETLRRSSAHSQKGANYLFAASGAVPLFAWVWRRRGRHVWRGWRDRSAERRSCSLR